MYSVFTLFSLLKFYLPLPYNLIHTRDYKFCKWRTNFSLQKEKVSDPSVFSSYQGPDEGCHLKGILQSENTPRLKFVRSEFLPLC